MFLELLRKQQTRVMIPFRLPAIFFFQSFGPSGHSESACTHHCYLLLVIVRWVTVFRTPETLETHSLLVAMRRLRPISIWLISWWVHYWGFFCYLMFLGSNREVLVIEAITLLGWSVIGKNSTWIGSILELRRAYNLIASNTWLCEVER